jgi:predicted NBD/HSP70 family sugar kinase
MDIIPEIADGASRTDDMRRRNLARVLSEIHLTAPLTRSELASRLGLNRSTISALVGDLTEIGLLNEHIPTGAIRAGRPSHVVDVQPNGPFVVAVDMEVTGARLALVGVGGHIRARSEIEFTATRETPELAVAELGQGIEALIADQGNGCPAIGVGVSIPGTVTRQGNQISFAPNLEWHDVPFASRLSERVSLPVALGNDADLGAWAEHRRGSGRRSDDLVYLTGKVGVGAGIISGGRALRGVGGLAGEVGHMSLDSSGPQCQCGSRGCVETLMGEAGLLRAARATGTRRFRTVNSLITAAGEGDERALRAMRAVAGAAGRVIAVLVVLLNPQQIIMGGSLRGVLDYGRPELEAELGRFAMSDARHDVRIDIPGLGDDSSLIGAAELAFGDLLVDPIATLARTGNPKWPAHSKTG